MSIIVNRIKRYALDPKNAKAIDRIRLIVNCLCVLTLLMWIGQFVLAAKMGQSVSPLAAYGMGFLVFTNLIIFVCINVLSRAMKTSKPGK
ncbi:hypothetical protein [Pseudomonas chlororaphis]|uniref:hypothetical protein n=1 Tax=Pseudomonas chlororaphis TaxID=587753 RepID=UPI002D797543|nr:hypothetical protein [Pseudomonas chlororaphis]